MKIGKQAFDTVERKAVEVEADLHRLTGLCAAEMRTLLGYPTLASTVAAALIPLLAEPIERHALAEAIAKAGVDEVRTEVQALYDKLLNVEAPSADSKTKA